MDSVSYFLKNYDATRGIVIFQKIGNAIHCKQGYTRQYENDFFRDT